MAKTVSLSFHPCLSWCWGDWAILALEAYLFSCLWFSPERTAAFRGHFDVVSDAKGPSLDWISKRMNLIMAPSSEVSSSLHVRLLECGTPRA